MKRSVKIALIIIFAIGLSTVGCVIIAKKVSFGPHLTQPGSTSDTNKPQKTALTCVESLPDSTLIGQKLMVAGYSDQLAALQPTLVQYDIGGVIVMDETSAQTIKAFHDAFKLTPIIAVDQEGGTVQRYKSEGIVPGASDMAANYTATQAYATYYADAQYLKSIGISVNFAPVLGVISASPNPLPGRMYSSDPSVVTQYASQFIKAYEKAGITPVVKHFPGLGSTTTNTDEGSATTNPLATLEQSDILPYKNVASLKSDAMISSAIVPDLTYGQPAVWSKDAVDLLRSYGYKDAIIYSDSLTGNAIPGTLQDATIKAWQAGVDVALIVQKPDEASILPGLFNAITAQAMTGLHDGTLDKTKFSESVVRIFARKNINPCSLM